MQKLGVIYRSRKENERRLALHPGHLELIPERLRRSIFFESGYGREEGLPDDELARRFGGVAERADLLAESDIVLLPKPLPEDLREMRDGAVLWGWPHCVQQREMTQVAIDRRLTLIAWESMFVWKPGDVRDLHIFERNNEMAGYCAVIHALALSGMDGFYGGPSRACVLSHGSVSRGAIHALQGRGFGQITVYTQRPAWAVHDRIPGCRYAQLIREQDGAPLTSLDESGQRRPLADALSEADLIANGILQDTDRPLNFLLPGEECLLRPGALIVDISCDLGMGFPFARPTSFDDPIFSVGQATYYGVDHTPSYLWRAATWELSRAVLPFLEDVVDGPEAWDRNETLLRAIEIRDGVIRNPRILRFQDRDPNYPHGPV